MWYKYYQIKRVRGKYHILFLGVTCAVYTPRGRNGTGARAQLQSTRKELSIKVCPSFWHKCTHILCHLECVFQWLPNGMNDCTTHGASTECMPTGLFRGSAACCVACANYI